MAVGSVLSLSREGATQGDRLRKEEARGRASSMLVFLRLDRRRDVYESMTGRQPCPEIERERNLLPPSWDHRALYYFRPGRAKRKPRGSRGTRFPPQRSLLSALLRSITEREGASERMKGPFFLSSPRSIPRRREERRLRRGVQRCPPRSRARPLRLSSAPARSMVVLLRFLRRTGMAGCIVIPQFSNLINASLLE